MSPFGQGFKVRLQGIRSDHNPNHNTRFTTRSNLRQPVMNSSFTSVFGGYGSWNSFSECSHPCGGIKTRRRTCSSPSPQNGGKDCSSLGPAEETVVCLTTKCVVISSGLVYITIGLLILVTVYEVWQCYINRPSNSNAHGQKVHTSQ